MKQISLCCFLVILLNVNGWVNDEKLRIYDLIDEINANFYEFFNLSRVCKVFLFKIVLFLFLFFFLFCQNFPLINRIFIKFSRFLLLSERFFRIIFLFLKFPNY